jgi:membrane-bound inhibitor of C-type lysozyme
MQLRFIVVALAIATVAIGPVTAIAQTFITYRCGDGSEFALAFFKGDKAAHVQLDGKALSLPKRMSLTGARYSRDDVTLRVTKSATTLKRGKRTTECTAS